MKLIKYTAAAAFMTGVASAQGLFDVNPNESESESLPLKYTVGVALGYDDNVFPTTPGPESSSSYMKGTVGANLVVRNEQTSWDLNALLGVTNYFDDAVTNDTTYNARLAYNLNHRVNERVRFVSRNFFNYGLDLGNFYGAVTARDINEYTYLSTDNAIGYRWTERLATYTGVAFSMVNYDDNIRDVDSYSIYNQFRYSLDQVATLTANLRFEYSEFAFGNTDRLTASVGYERRLSDVSSLVGEVGAQFADSNNGYGSLSYNYQVNTQLRARAFARYSQEDTDTVFVGGRYEDKTALRIGAAADYTLSPKITLTLGGNYTMSDYAEGGALADGEWDQFDIYAGASYKISDAFSVSASINHTTSEATVIPNRDYDRNRYELGVNYTF
jgi:hypothetical protein